MVIIRGLTSILLFECRFRERFGKEKDQQIHLHELSPSTCLDYDESLGWMVQEGDRRSQGTTILRMCNEDQGSFTWPESMKEAVIGMRDQGRAVHYIESSKQSWDELRQAHPGER